MSKNFITNIARIATNNIIDDKIINNPYNIDELLEILKYHQILPFLHHFKNVIQNKITFINEEVFNKSQEQTMKNLCRSMLYIDFLKKSTPPEFIMTKGFLHEFQFYINEGIRSFNDLDIFITKENYDKWIEFLNDNGFKKYENITDNFSNELIKKYSFAQHFINNDKNIAIDLHLNISNKMHPFQFDFSEFDINKTQVDVNGLLINTFSTEYLIIYLLYHCFKHYYFKLIWFIDLHMVLSTSLYDEQKLIQLIEKYKVHKLLQYYLNISQDILGSTGFPADSDILAKYSINKTRYINSDFVLTGEYNTSNSFNRLLLPLQYLPEFSLKYKYMLNQLFPPLEIIPEYQQKTKKHTPLFYLKNRFSKIQRLFNKDEL